VDIFRIKFEGWDAGDGSYEHIEWMESQGMMGWGGELLGEEVSCSVTIVVIHIEPPMYKSGCTERKQRVHVQQTRLNEYRSMTSVVGQAK